MTALSVEELYVEIRPNVDEVQLLLYGRVREGVEFWDDLTKPTEDQVEALISSKTDGIISRCEQIRDRHHNLAREVIILATAIAIERGFFPQEQANDSSILDELQAELDDKLSVLWEYSKMTRDTTLA